VFGRFSLVLTFGQTQYDTLNTKHEADTLRQQSQGELELAKLIGCGFAVQQFGRFSLTY